MLKGITKPIFTFLFVLACIGTTTAQPKKQTYPLLSLHVDNGLSEDYIYSLIQDRNGFIWIGTRNGLNKFDGYTIERINISCEIHVQEQIRSLLEDREGNIWIGTNNGLFCRKYETGIISKIDLQNEKVEVNCLHQDNSGCIWIGTSSGILFSYDRAGISQSYSIPDKVFVTNICQEKEELIIAFRYYGLARFDLKLGRFYYSPEDDILSEQVIQAVKKISSGDILIATSAGIFLKENNRQPVEITILSDTYNKLALRSNFTISQINDTTIWFGTDGMGVLEFNPVSKEINRVNLKSSVPVRSVTSIVPGENGLICLGTTNSGLQIYDPNRSIFEHWRYEKGNPTGLGGNSVLGITGLQNGDIAMALDGGGITIYDNDMERFTHTNLPGIDVSNTLFQSTKDELLWIGTFGNGLKFAKIEENNRLELNPKDTPIAKNSSIKCIYEDRKGNYWITTHTELYKYNIGTKPKANIQRAKNKHLANMFYVALEDADSAIWLGGLNRLTKYYPAKDSVENISLSSYIYFQITSLAQSKSNCIWVGTKMGLFKIDQLNEDTIQYTTQHGLPSNTVNSILYNDDENLWLGTDHGLVQMNIATETFRQFGTEDGIIGLNFNENSAFKGKDGRLYFGTTNGVYSFYPEEIVENKQTPDIAFTKFELFNKEVKVNDGSQILSTTLDLTKTIELKHYQNGISVEFLAVNYTNSSKNKYAYQLAGLSDEWVNLDNNRKVTWNNLSPGKYTLHVKASNNDGIWNETGRKLQINIAPPWWETWWALSIFSCLGLFTLILINRYVLKQFRLQDALKIEKIEKENQIKINDLKTQFFMNITHEFKTPLTLIISPLEKIISEMVKNSKQKKQLVMVYKNAIQLLRLINQLMDFRKVELGKTNFNPSQLDLIPFLNEVIQPFNVLAEEKGITVLFDQKPDELLWWFDPEKLEKIMYNLLSNALKHSPEFGTVEIILSSELNPQSHLPERVHISVSDNGPGIPEKDQVAIFERFHRLEDDSSTGTGIGLSLAKSFTEMHGGTLSVESKTDRGTKFKIRLPMVKPTNMANNRIGSTYNGDLLQNKFVSISENYAPQNIFFEEIKEDDSRYKILAIEDEKEIRDFIVETLNPYFNVAQAANGEEGLAVAKSEFPDLIISDVIMPKVDGFELCRQIKTNNELCHIPVLLLTALSSEEEQIKGLDIGADDYIYKPFNANTLIYKIKTIIENRRKIINRFKTETAMQPVDIVSHSADEELVKKTVAVIKENISDPNFKVDTLIDELGMSRSAFFRKIKAITLMSPNEFIRAIRLKHSAELLIKSDLNISQISYEVGFVSPKYFRECFKKHFGVTPSEYSKRGTINPL